LKGAKGMAKIPTIEYNVNRLYHLMSILKLTENDLLGRISEGKARKITPEQVFRGFIKLSHLKQIDKIFEKGLSYYIDPADPVKNQRESIFFRKQEFNADLNLSSRRLVRRFEELKASFETISALSDQKIQRTIPVFSLKDNPVSVGLQIRKSINPQFDTKERNYLQNLIEALSDHGVLVLEYVEHPALKEKINIEGFFLSPNTIVLKRNQKYFKREIFTLVHELGHYLLAEESIDSGVTGEIYKEGNGTDTEFWCNDFAFSFLAGDYGNRLTKLDKASASNDYHHRIVNEVSQYTHLSTIAIYTRFLMLNIVSPKDYKAITSEIYDQIRANQKAIQDEIDRKKQEAIDQGKEAPRGQLPVPILSPLYVSTLKNALYDGIIDETVFCKKLNIKPEKMEELLYESYN
jgi:Zn-dependent peptidase ImmA (M78 family)